MYKYSIIIATQQLLLVDRVNKYYVISIISVLFMLAVIAKVGAVFSNVIHLFAWNALKTPSRDGCAN